MIKQSQKVQQSEKPKEYQKPKINLKEARQSKIKTKNEKIDIKQTNYINSC